MEPRYHPAQGPVPPLGHVSSPAHSVITQPASAVYDWRESI